MKLLLTGTHLQKFCEIIGNCKYLTEFITVNLSEEGIHSQGMSTDHCSIYDFTIKASWFDDYEWDKALDLPQFSVSTEILFKILQTRQHSQYMIIEFFGKTDNITIRFASKLVSGKNQEFPKEFSIPLIDVEWEKLDVTDHEYEAEFGIGSKSIQLTNDQLSLFDETLTIHCSESEIYLRSKGIEGELTVTLYNDKCEHITEFSIDEDLSLTIDFSIKHFNNFCKFLKVSSNVYLSFKKDFPMKFEYIMDKEGEQPDDYEPELSLAFYLAPKIMDD
jgi:proliferating cell nuclear antigen PCNA